MLSLFRVRSAAALVVALCIAPAPYAHAQTAGVTAAPAAGSDITVLSTGATPRRALRYSFSQGASETVTMRQQMSMTMEMGGMAMPPQALPATLITTKLSVENVAADGSAALAGEIVSVEVDTVGADPALVNAMQPQLAALNGTQMRYRVSPTGLVSDLQYGDNPAMAEAARALQSADQLSVPFPTENVGVGAKWQVMRSVTQNGLTIGQQVEYTVKSLDADGAELEVLITQSAKDQAMDAAAMPAGASAKLRSLEGKGTSSSSIRFNRLQPSVDMKLDMKMAIDIEMGGESNSMNQSMTMEMKTLPPATP